MGALGTWLLWKSRFFFQVPEAVHGIRGWSSNAVLKLFPQLSPPTELWFSSQSVFGMSLTKFSFFSEKLNQKLHSACTPKPL